MKRVLLLGLIGMFVVISGCSIEHNFMDVDNPNAKEDLEYYIGSGNIPKINSDDIIPNSLSGTRKDAKGYANKYYEDTIEEYVDKAKEGLSGAKENIKGYYNDSVDELNKMVSEKVNNTISGELNKFKIRK